MGGPDLGEGLPIVCCEPVVICRPSKQYPLRMVLVEINIKDSGEVSIHPLPKTECSCATSTL